jgi:hypothetical protein
MPLLRRTRATAAAALLALALAAGCEGAEPSTTIEGEEEPAIPGEPGAADPAPSPDPEDLPGSQDADG